MLVCRGRLRGRHRVSQTPHVKSEAPKEITSINLASRHRHTKLVSLFAHLFLRLSVGMQHVLWSEIHNSMQPYAGLDP